MNGLNPAMSAHVASMMSRPERVCRPELAATKIAAHVQQPSPPHWLTQHTVTVSQQRVHRPALVLGAPHTVMRPKRQARRLQEQQSLHTHTHTELTMRAATAAAVAVTVAAATAIALPATAAAPIGASVGNFGISATCGLTSDTSAVGDPSLGMYVRVNPPVLGQYLATPGNATLRLNCEAMGRMAAASSDVTFPVCTASFGAGATPAGVTGMAVNVFAPIAARNSSVGFLPVMLAEVTLNASSAAGAPGADRGASAAMHNVSFSLHCDAAAGLCNGTSDAFSGTSFEARSSGAMFVVATAGASGDAVPSATYDATTGTLTASVAITLHPGDTSVRVVLAIGSWDKRGYYTVAAPGSLTVASWEAMASFTVANSAALSSQHASFVASLPRTGDDGIDASVRWFQQSALLLTKGTADDPAPPQPGTTTMPVAPAMATRATPSNRTVITMGYVELNQRDSYWTTWLHVLLWPDLDAAMINESILWQQPDGKIPTTILPLILRDDNIDVTAYFVLRVARHLLYNPSQSYAAAVYPAVSRAVAYLASRCGDGGAVPQAVPTSQWADWKDVSEVIGRQYAPHYDLLYLAALQAAEALATSLGRAADAAKFSKLRVAGDSFVNAPLAAGGMWAGTHYRDRWYDGRNVTWVLQDQVVGVFFGAVNASRADAVFGAFADVGNAGAHGTRETYPYIAGWGGRGPGNYHNGGVWPWLK